MTGVPALHGPPGTEEPVGDVTGFVLGGPGRPRVYVSGDNASLEVVRDIAERAGPFEVAIVFAGAARTALAGGAPLMLTSDDAAAAAGILGRPETIAVHFEGWAHFSEGAEMVRASFAREGLSDVLHVPRPGELIVL